MPRREISPQRPWFWSHRPKEQSNTQITGEVSYCLKWKCWLFQDVCVKSAPALKSAAAFAAFVRTKMERFDVCIVISIVQINYIGSGGRNKTKKKPLSFFFSFCKVSMTRESINLSTGTSSVNSDLKRYGIVSFPVIREHKGGTVSLCAALPRAVCKMDFCIHAIFQTASWDCVLCSCSNSEGLITPADAAGEAEE